MAKFTDADLDATIMAAEASPPEEMVEVRIDLPPHSGALIIDGRQYFHGFTYKVNASQARSFHDIMDKAWRHEKEVRGERKPFDSYRRSI